MFELEDLYDFTIEGAFANKEEFIEFAKNTPKEEMHLLFKDGVFADNEEFLKNVNLPSSETELTEEMMETGQRNAAPEYAMTEDKFEAEKKKDGESPLQDGVSADVVEEPVVEEVPQYEEITPELVSQDEEEPVVEDETKLGVLNQQTSPPNFPSLEEFVDLSFAKPITDPKSTKQPDIESYLAKKEGLLDNTFAESVLNSSKMKDLGEIEMEMYRVDGKYISSEKLQNLVYNQRFIEEAQNGLHSIEINPTNNPEIAQFINPELEALVIKNLESGTRAGDKWDSAVAASYSMASGVTGLVDLYYRTVEQVTGLDLTKSGIGAFESEGSKEISQEFANKAEARQEKVMQYRDGFVDSWLKGNPLDALQQGGDAVGGSIPYSASAAALTAMGGPALTFSVLAPIGASSELTRMDLSQEDKIKGLSEAERLTRAYLIGSFEAGSDVVAGKAITRSFDLNKYIWKSLVKDVAKKGGEEAARKAAEQTSKGILRKFGDNIGMQMTEEYFAEGGSQFLTMLTDDLMGIENYSADQYFKMVNENGLLGAFSGGVTTGSLSLPSVGLAGTVRINNDAKKYYDKLLRTDPESIKEKIDRINIDPTEKESVLANIESREKAVNAVPKDKVEDTKTVDLIQEKQALQEELKGIDDAFKAPIERKIAEVNEKLKAIYEAEPVTEEVVTEEKPTPRVFDATTDERYAVVNEGKGDGDRVLTKKEYDEYVAPAEEVVEEAEISEEVTVKKKDEVQTGKPLKIRYNKNPQKAPDMGAEFGQDVEASGDYVTQKVSDFTPEGFETGVVESENPLVIDITDDTQIPYKNELSQRYEGKVGEELSEAIRQDGYDAIVTKYDDGSTGEIVLLKGQRDAIQEPSTEAVDVQEPARDGREMGEGDVREVTEEVDTQDQSPEAEAQVKQEADDLADALGLDDDIQFSLGTDESGPINATIDFQSRLGKTFSTSKTFKDQGHMDNYIRFMEKKGNKEVGVTIDKGAAISESETPKKRRFANKAVVTVGNTVTGEAKLEIGRINPIMIDGQEFAKMTKVAIPNDAKFAATKAELYTKAMDLAVSEGLGGVIVSKELFNEAAVDSNKFDITEKTDNVLITPKADSKFQLETDVVGDSRKEALEKEADDLMNEVQPDNVETIEDVEGVEPIPVNLEENVEPVERTGIKRFKLRDIIGKKLNLLMADKLKIELKDPSKPYNQETNPYVKMGGNFFPLMDKMFGKVAWASITDAATTKIIKGAMDGDLSAVYNMGDGGVDSNIAIPTSLDAALDKLFPPDNKGNVNPKKDEIFQLIKARVLKSNAKEIKKAHKHFKNASTIMEAFKSLTDEEVKVRAAVMNWVVPTSLSNVSTSIELYNKLSDLGISIETLRDENAEQFAKDLPDGAITMIVEVQDENGVPVRERKLQLDKDLADKKITKKQYDKAINDVIQSAKMTLEQQNQEGVPSHPNYPVYIRGKAIALMEETASFFKIISEYRQKFNERVSGIDKKKTGNVKEGATEIEESVYNQIKEAKKDSTSKEAKKEIIEALLKGDVKKLKNGKVKTETIALLKEALKLNNKTGIKEILAIAETPFAETTQYTAGGIRSADMTSGMTTSTTSYEIVEYLRDQHSRFLTRLSKSFPSVDVVLSQAEFDAIISDAQAKKLVLANQKVYGAVYEGKLYLNPNLPNYNTPIHEFGHVWLNVARELGKDTYKKGMALMTKDSPYYQQVINSKEYGKIIDKMRKDDVSEADIETYIKEEALATAIGDKGESFTSAAANKNFKNWLNELFEFIGKLTGISELTPDQLQNINLDEFVQGVVVDIMSENEVFAGAEVKSFGEQLQLMTVPENSMNKIIEFGRAENFSDASIKELLKKRGFKVADINNAMVVNIDIETQLPSEFNRVKGGVGEATQMFKDVRKKLSTFAKGKRKKIPAKKLTADEKKAKANELRRLSPSLFEMSDDAILKKFPEPAQYEAISSPTISEVREKAMELLKAHPIFQKQSAAVQGAILVGFDKTIGTRSNKKVQDVINNIKNKAKSMREGVKSIKEAQKELKAALKDMPMSQDIRRIIKAVGDINQDNVLAQLERVSELVDNIKSKEAVSDAQKRALQMKIDQLKKNAKAISSLKGDMRRFIRQSLPLSDMYSKAQLNKVAAIIDNINFDNQVNQVQKLFDLVDVQRSKMKKATVKRMLDKAKKYATKSRKGKLVAKAGSVEAQGQAFFAEAAKILQYAYNNDTESMLKLAQELSDLDGIDEIVQKEINGEKLTQQEQALLDRVYAFDTFGDIMSMELEDVMTLEEAANDVKNESAVRLKNARLERSERYSKLSRESEAQIKKGFRELFTINGILKTKNQLNKSSKAIYEEFKRNGTVAAVKKLIDDIGYSNYNPISLIRNLMLHMGTMSTILDKGGKFFTDNIVTPLKDANENNLRGYQQQIQKLDELANAVKGIDGGFKQVMKLLKGKGMFVVGIETGTRADIDAIRAMVQQNPTDPKTLAKAKELISKAVKERMKYLTMSKSDIKAQMKAINETLDATTLIEEQVEYIDAISKLKQVDGMTLTKDQLLRIYALSKNDVQREKLKGQGFTDQRMAEIEAFLGPELIAFADNTVDYLSGQYYESVNDVHVRVNDVNLDFIDNYFPTRSLRGIKPTEYGADNFAKSFGQMSPSAISQRVDTKSGVDLTETFASALKGHLQQMEKYKSYAETVNTIQKILAFDHVDKLLDRTGLKKMYYLTIDNDVNPSSESMVFFQWLANRFYGMTLGFKLIQIPKQATSFINAYEQYSFFKDGKKKKLGGLGPDLMGFAYDYAKVLFFFRSNLKQARLNSATFNQRIIDAYQGDIFGLESGSQVTKEQKNQFIRWWNVASASPTTFGDALGVMGYMAVYNRNIANGMSPKEALKVFNDYNETQQSRRGTEASPIQVMAKKQPLLRMITMFSSTMLLQMNKVYQSSTNVMRDISNKKVPSKSDIRSIYLNVGLANVLFVLAGNIMKLIDGDDKDKEEVYTEIVKAMFFMNQLKKIPVIGTAVGVAEAMVEGKPPRSGIQGPLDRLTYDVAKSIKDEKYGELGKRVLDFGASTNFDMFQGIIQGTTEGFEDEVIYDTMGLPKSARPEGKEEKKGGSGGRFTTRSSTR